MTTATLTLRDQTPRAAADFRSLALNLLPLISLIDPPITKLAPANDWGQFAERNEASAPNGRQGRSVNSNVP